MNAMGFDDRNIRWSKLEGIDHAHYWILGIDETAKIIDVIFRLEADSQIVLHRHKVLNHTFVMQGEHRLYHPNGEIKDIRPVGRYTITPASDDTHREGGGKGQDAVVMFSIRGGEGVLYELLDNDLNVLGTLTFQGFVELFEAQKAHTAN